jgi:catechol 2,3-dioxygenase-like lactoylglutathione lyase family enzyme
MLDHIGLQVQDVEKSLDFCLHAPREWPQYHPGYYGVFLRDLDGHNVEAVCHGLPG